MTSQQLNQLEEDWRCLYTKYSSNQEQGLDFWQELKKQYTGSKRFYHNLTHIADLLTQAKQMEVLIKDPDVLYFSIWYHDIIYKSWRKDNELQSALLAQQRLKTINFPAHRIQACYDQILLTQSHQTESASLDAQYLIDFDLSILGRPWERYEAYTANVREEYRLFPDFMYRTPRKKALQHFLDRKAIYATPYYREHFEEQARKNLRRELAKLI